MTFFDYLIDLTMEKYFVFDWALVIINPHIRTEIMVWVKII